MAEHELKTWPEYFEAVRKGEKPFEVRRHDRHFAVGDTLILQEFEPGTKTLGATPAKEGRYTGRRTDKYVTYVMDGGRFGLEPGFVVLGIR